LSAVVFVDVDVQRDFCDAGGALLVPGSPNDVFRKIVAFAVASGAPIIGSVDSHAHDAWEFASSGNAGPAGESPKFPDHCVKGTPGWLKVDGTLPPRFRFVPNVPGIDVAPLVAELLSGRTQGVYFEKEVYSLFANPNAAALVASLREAIGKRDSAPPSFAVFGVATDYCVRAAARGLRENGCQVTLLEDAIAGIDPAGSRAAIDDLEAIGVTRAHVADLGIE
jgi:nicotinamidase/pyrazinamidase